MITLPQRFKRPFNVGIICFLTLHITAIFFQGFWTTIDKYYEVHYEEKFDIPYMKWTRQSSALEPYYMFSGIDTGYGFYGIQTATEKYLKVTYYDAEGVIIQSDRLYGMVTSNGFSRLKGYGSKLSNYIVDTEMLRTKPDETLPKTIAFREEYIMKAFKWIGKHSANTIQGCHSYKVEVIAVVPQDIWDKNTGNLQPSVYSVKSLLFYV